jgi:hypothetical protein
MTQFSVSGPFYGTDATVTWKDGQLDGDFDLSGLASAYADQGVEVSVPGRWTGPADLSKPHTAYATLFDCLDGHVVKFSGDDPWLGFAEPPKGAIA